MLRVLFILLAVVSTILAFILERPLLYAAAGVLLLIAIVILVVQMRRRHAKSRESYITPPRSKEDELSSLGILEIRPKEKPAAGVSNEAAALSRGTAAPPPAPTHAEPRAEPSEENGRAAEAVPARAVLGAQEPEVWQAEAPEDEPEQTGVEGAAVEAARVREEPAAAPAAQPQAAPATGAAVAVRKPERTPGRDKAGGRQDKEALTATLKALQVAVGANTVCLLKQEELALRYDIVAIVSRNHYARSQGHFSTKVPLLTPSRSHRAVSLLRVGEKGVSARNLGYYIEPIAVRQLAIATVAHPSELSSYFVLADSMEDGGLGTARQRRLLTQFAELLGALLDTRESGGSEEPLEGEALEEEMRPRRDIIAEEMAKARAEGHPLALALLHLNRAEEVAAGGEDSVTETEQALETRLQESVGSGRLERFGELTYGVFYNEPVADVEAWAVALQRGLADAEGRLEGGISIGVAMLQDRHDDPDAFRADATEALREAYETGACTILA